MRIFVRRMGERVHNVEYPFALLYRDSWDDYGFKTTFSVEIWLGINDVASLGEVKILDKALPPTGGKVDLKDKIKTLPDSMVSLGQAYTYYETLIELGPEIYSEYLRAMNDIIFAPKLQSGLDRHPAYRNSLLRTGSAVRTLEDAPPLFHYGAKLGKNELEPLAFDFLTNVGGSQFTIPFRFCDTPHLPNRINAIIGYNGVGKTTLLANLAMVASADVARRSDNKRLHLYGSFVNNPELAFGSTIAISYSAFDTFELPGRTAAERQIVQTRGDLFGYVYCGLRKVVTEDRKSREVVDSPGSSRGTSALSLKSSDEISAEFLRSLTNAQNDSRRQILELALDTLALEPSFSRVGMEAFLAGSDNTAGAKKELERLSTGHKIVLNIVVQLIAHLQERSLVLVDEPESHLHPPLLAALLRSLSVALQERDSFAVVATHSPVVLQEVPRRYVHVLQRFGEVTQVREPGLETFGENIGLLTRDVFSLDSSQTDYHRVLDSLVTRFSIDEIEAMFSEGMSSQARAYVVMQQRRRT